MNEYKLNHYRQLVSFLGQILGPDYEVVLSDLKSVLAISNGHISGRSVGVPLSDVALKTLKAHDYQHENYILNYQGSGANGQLLRSSTFFIKSVSGKLEGLLCINFDDRRYSELAHKIFMLCHPDSFVHSSVEIRQVPHAGAETFYTDVSTMVEDMYQKAIADLGFGNRKLKYKDKMALVSILHQNGVFSVKGTIPELSKRLCVSTATLYRYIHKFRAEEQSTGKDA